MAGTRGHFKDVITGISGGLLKPLIGASVYVYKVGTTTQISSVYQNSSGSTLLSQPITANSSGEIEFWLEGEQNVDLSISLTGYTTTTKTVTVDSPDTIVPSDSANPAFQVDDITNPNAATGIKITANAAGSGVAWQVTSSGTNENVTMAAKGTGSITLNSPLVTTQTIEGYLNAQINTLPSGVTATLDSGYQSVVYGTYTINGTLTVNGEMRVVAWPS